MKPTTEIKAILFDLGAVLLNISYQKTIDVFQSYGIPNFHKQFSKAEQSELFNQYEKGEISTTDWLASMRSLSGDKLSAEQILHAWNAMLLDFPIERFKLLQRLSEKHPIYLLSNTNDAHISFCRNHGNYGFTWEEFEACFTKIFYSFEMGMRKPDEEIFLETVKQIGLPPHGNLVRVCEPKEIYYIDDSPQHIESAKKLGIAAHHLKDQEDVLALFEDW